MPIYSADLPPLHPVSFLWALPAAPAAGAAVLALAGRFLERRFGRAAVAGVAVVTTGLAAGLALAAVFGVLLAVAPGDRVLFDAPGTLVAVGNVVVPAALALDPLTGALALVLALGGAAAAVALVIGRAADLVRVTAALGAAVGGGLLLVLADNHLLALVGWEALALGGVALLAPSSAEPDATRRSARALMVSRVGQTAWLGGVVLLVWGLAPPDGSGARTVMADVRGDAGAAIELKTLGDRPRTASLRPVTVGPTLGLGEIAGQLALRDTAERRPYEEALLARRVGPLPLLPLACLGLLVGAACLGLAWLVARPSVGSAAAAMLASVGLVARVWPVFAPSLAARAAAAVVALAMLAVCLRVARRRVPPFFAPVLGRVARELGVLPVDDFARAAAWLERRVLVSFGRVVALAAGLVALGLVFQ